MAVAYFDASAFVKLVHEEDESEVADEIWDGSDVVFASRLAYPEVRAALAAAARNRQLTVTQLTVAERAWENSWMAVRKIELSADVEQLAGRLASRHALRGGDAVHLASAITIGMADLAVAAWDRRLRAAAAGVGLALAPASLA